MARPPSDLAARIVVAAGERFLREGVDGASLRNIARDAGTSVGMVYYYYPTKDDLFLAVVERVYAGLLADIEVALTPDAAVEVRLRRLYARLGAMTDDEALVVRLVIREALVSSDRLARLIERMARGHLPLVLGLLAQGRAEGDIAADASLPVQAIATFALGVIPQVVRRIVPALPPGMDLPEREELAAACLDVLLRGLRPRGHGENG